MNEFDDLTNTCCPGVDRDRTIVVRGRVRKSDSTTPQLHDQPTRPRAQSYTHARTGGLVFSSSCMDGNIARVGPDQNPQYTRGGSARKAVGSSQTTHHSTPPPHRMSPTTQYIRRQSLAVPLFSKLVCVKIWCVCVFFRGLRCVHANCWVNASRVLPPSSLVTHRKCKETWKDCFKKNQNR